MKDGKLKLLHQDRRNPGAGIRFPEKEDLIGAGRWLGKNLLDLLYPPRCPLCDRILAPDEYLICRKCAPVLPVIRQPVCLRCGRPLHRAEQEYCIGCQCTEHAFIRGECTFVYEKAFRQSVLRMKFRNRRDYLDFYAAAMAFRHTGFLCRIRPGVLLPVPMYPAKRARRGYDQCRLLARKLSALIHVPVQDDNLIRVRDTMPQKGLNREERRENLKDAFALKNPDILSEPVLLLDDIYTTGSTLDEIAKVLRENGFEEIYFLALCTEEEIS